MKRLLAAYIAVTGTIVAAPCRAAARGDLPTDTEQRQEANT